MWKIPLWKGKTVYVISGSNLSQLRAPTYRVGFFCFLFIIILLEKEQQHPFPLCSPGTRGRKISLTLLLLPPQTDHKKWSRGREGGKGEGLDSQATNHQGLERKRGGEQNNPFHPSSSSSFPKIYQTITHQGGEKGGREGRRVWRGKRKENRKRNSTYLTLAAHFLCLAWFIWGHMWWLSTVCLLCTIV